MPETNLNGVDTQKLSEMVPLVQQQPKLGRFEFRARNEWINGGHNRTTISEFYGVGEERGTRRKFQLDADEPEILLSGDAGANPVEHLLNALAACMTTSMVYHAAARGIRIESLRSELKGTIDLRGFLGISKDVRKGYQDITVKFLVQSDASPEQLRELCEFSPVFDVVQHGTKVNVEIEKEGAEASSEDEADRLPTERWSQPGNIGSPM